MKIAVQGCAHGELDTIYETIQYIESKCNVKIDLLLCCGDFQATRNLDDLECMAAPKKYRDLRTFYKYYSGEKEAPVLTILIGGNHEASNHMQELPYGGWVAPKIYYLGYAGVVKVGGIRIGGMSGIFKGFDYCKGKFEKPPYNDSSVRSCYHIRNLDVFRLKQLSEPMDIMLSHDWPSNVVKHGNVERLLKRKPMMKAEVEEDSLGSKPTAEVLDHLKPKYWFSAHLHVKYPALLKHDDETRKLTKFLALDKCLPGRHFLQVVDVDQNSDISMDLHYDLEWLTVLHLTNHLLSTKNLNCYMPTSDCDERYNFTPTAEEMEDVRKKFQNNLKIPENFVITATPYDPTRDNYRASPLTPKINPQTVKFCEKLGVDDPIVLLLKKPGLNSSTGSANASYLDNSSFLLSTDSEVDVTSSPSMNMSSPNFRGREMFKTPLKLPKPLNSSNISNDEECLTSTPYKSVRLEGDLSACRSFVDDDEKAESSIDDVNNDSSLDMPQVVSGTKFRRRNLAMYASNDDES